MYRPSVGYSRFREQDEQCETSAYLLQKLREETAVHEDFASEDGGGIRIILMCEVAKIAFELERKPQLDMFGGVYDQVIDGMTGSVFYNEIVCVKSDRQNKREKCTDDI